MQPNSWASQEQYRQASTWQAAPSNSGHMRPHHLDYWGGNQNYGNSPATHQFGDAQPPLPTEPRDAPPLPPDDEPPPLPPEDPPGLGAADAVAAPTMFSRASHAPHPWQTDVPGPWQISYQAQGAPQQAPGPANSAQMPPSELSNGFLPGHHQPQPSTSQPQWEQSWNYAGYGTAQQTPYHGAAYQSSHQAGYQDPNSTYAGYNGFEQHHFEYQQPFKQQAPLPWSQQQPPTPEAAQGGWIQPGVAPPIPAQETTPAAPTTNEVDAQSIFLKPGRDQRPRKLAVIMRGLPGSGKSHLAKKLKEIEAEHGGEAPRIHAIDDYFVTEVEKDIVEQEAGKKPKKKTVTVTEYLYEPELEDSYKQSILKAFTKTVEEGRFTFVILDAANILVEDFRPFYLAAQRTGYQVFVLKPLESDPEVCFQRNVHQRDRDTLSDLAALYEPTPKLFTQLLVDSLFDLPKPPKDEEAIEEVDMEDEGAGDDNRQLSTKSRWAALEEEEEEVEEDLPRKRRRKADAQETQAEASDGSRDTFAKAKEEKPASSSLRKPGSAPPNKSVRWADQAVAAEGFTIGASVAQQLTTVHCLEGLGPPKEDLEQLHATESSEGSFQDHAREDRKSEGKTFRDVLFGGQRL